MEKLKNQTFSGLFWTFLENFFAQGFQFLVGIILARILDPADFGKIGAITVFIVFAQSFTDSGFGNALIRKKDFENDDYSTVFYFNVLVSGFFYFIFILFSNEIALYFNDLTLVPLIKTLSSIILINAFGFVQRIIFTRNLDFKIQAKISFISSLISGFLGIFLALKNFGILSLVVLSISRNIISTILLWYWSFWRPSFTFKFNALKALFKFGGKLFVSSLIDSIYKNIFSIFIGKHFSLSDLGFYTRADQFKSIPSENLTSLINRVSFPVLSKLQEDLLSLRAAYIKIIRSTMFISFNIMMLLAAISKHLVYVLIGQKWSLSSEYLQLLCLVGMLYPLHSLNLNILQVLGKGGMFLKLELVKKILAIPVIFTGFFWGLKMLIFAMFIHSCISLYLNSYLSGKLLNYSIVSQLKDIIPAFVYSIIISIPVYLVSLIIDSTFEIILLLQLTFFVVGFIMVGEIGRNKDYVYLKSLLSQRIKIKFYGKQ